MELSFRKVSTLPSSYVPGGIYFNEAKGTVGVAVDESTLELFSGIADATFTSNKLTLTKSVGGTVVVDLTNYATKTELAAKLNVGSNSDTSSTQSYYGLVKLITEKLGSVYKVKETVADLSALQALTGVEIGDVHNVTAAVTLDGNTYPANTNFVATKAGAGNQEGMWDSLGGTFDMSDYVLKTTTVNGKPLTGNITLIGTDIEVGGTGAHKDKTIEQALSDIEDSIPSLPSNIVNSLGGQIGVLTVDTTAATKTKAQVQMSGKQLKVTTYDFSNDITAAIENSKVWDEWAE